MFLRERLALVAMLLPGALACSPIDSEAPAPPPAAATESLQVDFGAPGFPLVGVAPRPLAESDQVPVFRLEDYEIEATDATLDTDTRTIAWLAPNGMLWSASIESAPYGARLVGENVILGLAASHGRIAFAVRIDGPETAAFVYDLGTDASSALSDAPGSDEVIGFSPSGQEVLLLSGRTGLASLFAADIATTSARQLTNIGLVPGPALSASQVTPAPAHRRDVLWDASGLHYRSADTMIEVIR